jgi:hypothetical protein
MQEAFGSVTWASPLIFFQWDSYNNNSPGTSDTPSYEITCLMNLFHQVRKDSDGQFLTTLSIQATDILE